MSYSGQLNANEIYSSIFNMIMNQYVMNPSLADNYSELVSKFKTEGSLYGDTVLFYDQDVLASRPWLGDAEAANLLNINRPADPECQAVQLDNFRQIDITVDNYLTKRAWSTEGVFSQFTSQVIGMIGRTKKLYENTLVNATIGTSRGNATKSDYEVDITTATSGLTGEEAARMEAQVIAQSIADLLVEMKDYSRDFNDYGFMRAYNEDDLLFVWNSKYVNKILKIDLPTIFHKEGLVDKMDKAILPDRYFGEVIDDIATDTTNFAETSVGSGEYAVKSGVVVRTLEEVDLSNGTLTKHFFPADQIPAGYICKDSTIDLSGSVYEEDPDVICQVMTKDTFKYMAAFEVGTNFFNPRSLTENHYLTWGFSTPTRLLGQPLITVHAD